MSILVLMFCSPSLPCRKTTCCKCIAICSQARVGDMFSSVTDRLRFSIYLKHMQLVDFLIIVFKVLSTVVTRSFKDAAIRCVDLPQIIIMGSNPRFDLNGLEALLIGLKKWPTINTTITLGVHPTAFTTMYGVKSYSLTRILICLQGAVG